MRRSLAKSWDRCRKWQDMVRSTLRWQDFKFSVARKTVGGNTVARLSYFIYNRQDIIDFMLVRNCFSEMSNKCCKHYSKCFKYSHFCIAHLLFSLLKFCCLVAPCRHQNSSLELTRRINRLRGLVGLQGTLEKIYRSGRMKVNTFTLEMWQIQFDCFYDNLIYYSYHVDRTMENPLELTRHGLVGLYGTVANHSGAAPQGKWVVIRDVECDCYCIFIIHAM